MEIVKIEDMNKKTEISNSILNQLPDWFGIPEAITEYTDKSRKMPFWAAYDNEKAVGFISVKQNNEYSAEIYVMGIKEEYHHKGIGRKLFQQCYSWCRENNIEFLQVKTLDGSNPDPYYARTREFYKAMGFRPLECFPELWDKANPCLIMIMHIS